MRHGAVWLWSRPRLRYAVLFLCLVTTVTAMQPPLIYEFITRHLGRSERELGLIFAAAGLGGILGAVFTALLRGVKNHLRAMGWFVAANGLLLFVFAVNTSLAGAMILFSLFGAISTGIQINLATFLQRETPPEKRGRVFGWLAPMIGPVTLLSVLTGPLLAGWVGVVAVLAVAGTFELVFGVAGALTAPRSEHPGGAAHEDVPEDVFLANDDGLEAMAREA